MPSSPVTKAVEHLRKTILWQEEDHLSDGQLLDRFLETRDHAAFAALVRRHGPMVWGVCLRIVGHADDAEDAFQAAFLILVRKAATVKPREAVGNWLYGVASHAALKARTASARIRAKEKQVTSMPDPAEDPRDGRDELQKLLDKELRFTHFIGGGKCLIGHRDFNDVAHEVIVMYLTVNGTCGILMSLPGYLAASVHPTVIMAPSARYRRGTISSQWLDGSSP